MRSQRSFLRFLCASRQSLALLLAVYFLVVCAKLASYWCKSLHPVCLVVDFCVVSQKVDLASQPLGRDGHKSSLLGLLVPLKFVSGVVCNQITELQEFVWDFA